MTERTLTKEKTAVARTPERDDLLVADLLASAKTPQDRSKVYELADAVQQARLLRRAASMIAATTWGMGLSADARVALGRYCLEVGADPLRHVDLLGGNVFFNSDYYRDLIVANPEFVRDEKPVWFHEDERLKQDANNKDLPQEVRDEALKEMLYRRRERIDRNIPEDTPAACLVRLHYKGRGPFEGIGLVHGGKVTNSRDPAKRQNDRDPIGLDNPRTTAESRAWREAGEKAEPIWFRNHPRVREIAARLTELHDAGALREPAPAAALPPAGVVMDEGGVVDLGATESIQDERFDESKEPIEKHNPNALCDVEGPHPRSLCGMYRKDASS